MAQQQGIWIIGYGSLIFKPPPLYSFRVTGYLQGYIRRFWQSSSDHRGTPKSPGRVATLISFEDLLQNPNLHRDLSPHELQAINESRPEELIVWGAAYYIAPEHVEEMKKYLDVREQDGYTTHSISFKITEYQKTAYTLSILENLPVDESNTYHIESTVYIGTLDNPSFIGPEEIVETANIIHSSSGPSGPNVEYLVNLVQALGKLSPDVEDLYLENLLALANKN